MSCKCDSGTQHQRGQKCPCEDHPPLPAGSPRRALNPKVCRRPGTCGTGSPIPLPAAAKERKERTKFLPKIADLRKERLPDIHDNDFQLCVSVEPNRRAPCSRLVSRPPPPTCPAANPNLPPEVPPCRTSDKSRSLKPLKKRYNRVSSEDANRCRASEPVVVLCGETAKDAPASRRIKKISALDRTISRAQWEDDEGYHMIEAKLTQLCEPEEFKGSSSCSKDKKLKVLRSKLKGLLAEAEPIPEHLFPDNINANPEPEVVAAALLMSQVEGNDLGSIHPKHIFGKLFSQCGTDQSIAIASTRPVASSNIVLPITVEGYPRNGGGLEIPNMTEMLKQTRTTVASNLNAFEKAEPSDAAELLQGGFGLGPDAQEILRHLGRDETQKKEEEGRGGPADSMLEYTLRQEPSAYRNCIQLNGSVKPSWFPGYMLVSPLLPQCITITADPGEALLQAWRLCQPQHFHDASKSLINTA